MRRALLHKERGVVPQEGRRLEPGVALGALRILAPVLAGLIADRYGTENAFLFAGALVFLSAVIILFLRLPRTATQVAGGRR